MVLQLQLVIEFRIANMNSLFFLVVCAVGASTCVRAASLSAVTSFSSNNLDSFKAKDSSNIPEVMDSLRSKSLSKRFALFPSTLHNYCLEGVQLLNGECVSCDLYQMLEDELCDDEDFRTACFDDWSYRCQDHTLTEGYSGDGDVWLMKNSPTES